MKSYTVRLDMEVEDASLTFVMEADDNPDVAHEEICNYVFGHITVDTEPTTEGDSNLVGSDCDGSEY